MKIKPPGAALVRAAITRWVIMASGNSKTLGEALFPVGVAMDLIRVCPLSLITGRHFFFFFSEGLLLFFQTQVFHSFSTLGERLFSLITTPKMSFAFLPQNTIITCMWSKAELHSFAMRRASPWQGLRVGRQSICWDDSQQSSVLFG